MSASPGLIRREDSVLVVVDMQARVLDAIQYPAALARRVAMLLDAASLLDVPVLFTLHCGSKLGPVRPDLIALAPNAPVLAKTHFCALEEPHIAAAIHGFGRNQIIVVGVEAHVCVLQTALALQNQDYGTYVVSDAVGTRREHDHAAAAARLSAAGAIIVTAEMVAFEWVQRADVAAFKDLIQLLKPMT
jgi:nicotinamidase-related amidase